MASKSNFINKTFGHYNLIVQIARGTSSDVYLALPTNDSQHKVVVKMLRSVRLTSPQEHDSFLQKAQFLTQLKHPYILPIVDIGVEKGVPYVVTEYAPHGSLHDRLKRMFSPRLSRQEILRILSQIGQALNYVHERNILHCNIKPENILFNEKDEALLADFGLASLLEAVDARFKPRDIFYQAPEQSKGVVSKESDQYALGCIAYKLFSEQVSLADLALDKMRLKQGVKASMPFPSDLPQYMQKAVLKATTKKPGERHANVLAFVNALNDVFQPAHELPQKDLTNTNAALPVLAKVGAGTNGFARLSVSAEVALVNTEFEAAYKSPTRGHARKPLPAPVKWLGFALSGLIIMATILSFLTPFNPLMAALTLRPVGRAAIISQKTAGSGSASTSGTKRQGVLTACGDAATDSNPPPNQLQLHLRQLQHQLWYQRHDQRLLRYSLSSREVYRLHLLMCILRMREPSIGHTGD